MRKEFIITLCFSFLAISIFGQKYYTKEGSVKFTSKAPLETIEGVNNKAMAVLDAETGRLEMAVLVKAFSFEKSLMEEHFNENYMESDKYPKAIFKGHVVDWEDIDYKTNGMHNITISGDLTMHGETRELELQGALKIENGNLVGTTSFKALLEDYKIKIPSVVKDNISKEVNITVYVNLIPLEKS